MIWLIRNNKTNMWRISMSKIPVQWWWKRQSFFPKNKVCWNQIKLQMPLQQLGMITRMIWLIRNEHEWCARYSPMNNTWPCSKAILCMFYSIKHCIPFWWCWILQLKYVGKNEMFPSHSLHITAKRRYQFNKEIEDKCNWNMSYQLACFPSLFAFY